MSKHIKFMALAMMAVFSLAFVSCSDDDDDEPSATGSQLVINGKSYNISFNQTGVMWNEAPLNSIVQFSTGKDGIMSSDGKIFTFGFPAFDNDKYIEPKVGLDISKLKYEISEIGETIAEFTLEDDNEVECNYISGSLIITELNQSQGSITLKFNDLKMGNGETSYTFNGTIKLPFTD